MKKALKYGRKLAVSLLILGLIGGVIWQAFLAAQGAFKNMSNGHEDKPKLVGLRVVETYKGPKIVSVAVTVPDRAAKAVIAKDTITAFQWAWEKMESMECGDGTRSERCTAELWVLSEFTPVPVTGDTTGTPYKVNVVLMLSELQISKLVDANPSTLEEIGAFIGNVADVSPGQAGALQPKGTSLFLGFENMYSD